MPSFGIRSNDNLKGVHPTLQTLCRRVVKRFDCSVIAGLRTAEEQFKLYQKGRDQMQNGNWVIVDKSKVVTYMDGTYKRSNHQVKNDGFGHAVDMVPYPIDWSNRARMIYFGGYVLGVADEMGIKVRWLGDPDGDRNPKDGWDLPHFELVL